MLSNRTSLPRRVNISSLSLKKRWSCVPAAGCRSTHMESVRGRFLIRPQPSEGISRRSLWRRVILAAIYAAFLSKHFIISQEKPICCWNAPRPRSGSAPNISNEMRCRNFLFLLFNFGFVSAERHTHTCPHTHAALYPICQNIYTLKPPLFTSKIFRLYL